MPTESLPPAVRIAFVPFCVGSLSRSEIDRVFKAHGVALPPDTNPYSKTNLVDAYCQLFDWKKELDELRFRAVVNDVLSLSRGREPAAQALATFLSVCGHNGVAVEDNQLVTTSRPTAQAPRPAARTPGVRKVLFFASSPSGKARLRLDVEAREVSEGLRRSNERDRFELITSPAPRIPDLRRGLLDHSPHIVHFSGHGGDDGIVVENEKGRAAPVPFDALAELFGLCREHVECAVLNACLSDLQAEAIAEHIPFVIGMSSTISDPAAIEFAVGFYDALGAGRTIEAAFGFAKNAIALKGIPGDATPVLLKRKG